ncbi:MAG: hypothetical protein FD153_1261 [Rhodospirillaceae bacterium]|nr:MAG: hypothetical protein FD153_1261 [Rhodospirillaceae bacterium]
MRRPLRTILLKSIMPAVAFGLFLAVVSISAAVAQEMVLCPLPPGEPVVDLYIDEGPIRFDHDVTQAQIEALYREEGSLTHGVLGHPVGLTRMGVKFDIRTELRPLRLPTGLYCLWLVRVDALLRYADTVIYIDRRFEPGSCQYETVLDHEYTHIAINREMLRLHAPRIRMALAEAVRRINPVVVEDLFRDRDQPIALLQAAVEAELNAFNQARDQANSTIDTPDNYRRTQALCSNW